MTQTHTGDRYTLSDDVDIDTDFDVDVDDDDDNDKAIRDESRLSREGGECGRQLVSKCAGEQVTGSVSQEANICVFQCVCE